MVDIELRLKQSCENIDISFIDPKIVLEKAKLRKQKRKFDISKLLKISFISVGAVAAASVVIVPLLSGIIPMGGRGAENASDTNNKVDPSFYNDDQVFEPLRSYEPNLMKKKANIDAYNPTDINADISNLSSNVNTFSSSLFSEVNQSNVNKANVSYSPVSLFNAVAMLSKTVQGESKGKLLNYLGVSEETLENNLASLIKGCNAQYIHNDKITGKEILDNCIWLDNNHFYNQDTLKNLADDYYTNSFWGDFENETSSTNKLIEDYVFDLTEGKFRPTFDFGKSTSFVLMNNVFFGDDWDEFGNSLDFAGNRNFTGYGNSKNTIPFYASLNNKGKVIEKEKYSSMFATSEHGYTVDFMVPKDGVQVDELFTSEILNEHVNDEYVTDGSCHTDVIFPDFKASFQGNLLSPVLKAANITGAINDFGDFALNKNTGENTFSVTSIMQNTRINISHSSTAGETDSSNSSESSETRGEKSTFANETFVVDRSFVYTIKNPKGIILFQGIIYKA